MVKSELHVGTWRISGTFSWGLESSGQLDRWMVGRAGGRWVLEVDGSIIPEDKYQLLWVDSCAPRPKDILTSSPLVPVNAVLFGDGVIADVIKSLWGQSGLWRWRVQ